MSLLNMSDRYQPQEVEASIYRLWEEHQAFKALDVSTKPPFSIILPPPNVTGFLHLGHALNMSIQDCLIRWKKMNGFNVLWLPGTDHAGIATQVVVEKHLQKMGLNREQLGREKFLEKVWEWKRETEDRIYSQLKRLGGALDWSRATFTLDEGVSRAVTKVFVSLYRKGLIYRGLRLVNWSGPLQSAISDLEVEFKEVKGRLYLIKYPLTDSNEHLIVATTRPETLLGDTAVCVHPKDDRYQRFIGKKVRLPLIGREISVIADESIDPQFGTGVVKVTPAHDFNDYKLGRKYNLDFINILDKMCYLNENAGIYRGLSVTEARRRIVHDLKESDLLVKEEPHIHQVGHCSRTGAVIEPLLSEQWFVKMSGLAQPARAVVESGTITLEPEAWIKTYLHWLNNIEDWCISRQLWWGHRIPAWYCQVCSHVYVDERQPGQCEKCGNNSWKQDEDVLDTWFSSALWPFTTLGWPAQTEALKTFYPTSVLVTGHDILFFWVARMIMMGLEFVKDVPFRKVYLHGLVRDDQGTKMSKSLDNSIDPIDVIEKYGADALRFNFLAHIHSGKDFQFSEERVQGYRNFINKLWNAARFVLTRVSVASFEGIHGASLAAFDRWILQRLWEVERDVEQGLEQCRFSDAAHLLYHFVWNDFCDWYIEFSKVNWLEIAPDEKENSQKVMLFVLDRIIALLHPFIPFVTEEIFQKLPYREGQLCILQNYPTTRLDKELKNFFSSESAFEVELLKAVLHSIRQIRGENRISPAQEIGVKLRVFDEKTQKILGNYRKMLMLLGRISSLEISPEVRAKKAAVSRIVLGNSSVTVAVPLEGLVNIEEEIKRLTKAIEKAEKTLKELERRLSQEAFLKNANPEVVEHDRQQSQVLRVQIQTWTEARERLLRNEEFLV
ncbi:MAG: valine--tRNA ligase [Pseudobdellovibrionaceae bacterium]|nr:valine--tRNA ligase [Pseudobdellovibrionaceae bacterium]